MSHFQLFSKKIRFLFQILFFVVPLLTLFYWFTIEQALRFEINPFHIPQGKFTLNTMSKFLGLCISLLPISVVMLMCYQLSALFKNYQHGKVFTQENATYYQKLGYLLFSYSAIQLLCPPLMSLVLSFQNPIGERFISVSIGTPQLLPIIIALIIMGISYVMKEAYRFEMDEQYTI